MTSPVNNGVSRVLRNYSVLSLAAALACGCAVGPDFKRPDAP